MTNITSSGVTEQTAGLSPTKGLILEIPLAERIAAVIGAWRESKQVENSPSALIVYFVESELDADNDLEEADAIAALASCGIDYSGPSLGGCKVYIDGRVEWGAWEAMPLS